jgi:hypothetical protein
MEKSINERFIQFAGGKSGGSQRIPVPFDIEIGEDAPVTIKGTNLVFNCVKAEYFDNQDGTINVLYILKSTLE